MKDVYSYSPISNNKYSVSNESDASTLNNFIKQSNRKKTVAVQGLGFVGTVMSVVIANSDDDLYNVIGVDTNREDSFWKIGDINNGIVPVISSDPLVEKFYQESLKRKNFIATHDVDAFLHADVIIVDINLDVKKSKTEDYNIKSFDVPMQGFSNAMQSISKKCKKDVLQGLHCVYKVHKIAQ